MLRTVNAFDNYFNLTSRPYTHQCKENINNKKIVYSVISW